MAVSEDKTCRAEVAVDHQHGTIVRVICGDTSVAVYLQDETAVVTKPGGQHGLEVLGPWHEFRAALTQQPESDPRDSCELECGAYGTYCRCKDRATHERQAEQPESDRPRWPKNCPRCAELMVFPRPGDLPPEVDHPYCEDCGWPTEDLSQPESEPAGYIEVTDVDNLGDGESLVLHLANGSTAVLSGEQLDNLDSPVAQPTPQVPEGWRLSENVMGEIQLDSPDDHHCIIQERGNFPPHDPVNMLHALCHALLAAPSIAEEREVEPDQPDLPLTDGYALLPRELTAENGAKYLLSGEFNESVTLHCDHCDGEDFDCEICNGADEYSVDVPVGWTTIKNIHRMVVEHLSRPEPPAGGEQ